jgi:FkbM family methyltransferase
MRINLLEKASRYLAEINFAFRCTPDIRSGLALAKQTLRFHAKLANQEFDVPVRFSVMQQETRTYPLRLRSAAGDLFIFYEVLLDEVYRVPVNALAPASVRWVIDCGANVGLSALYFAAKFPNATILAIEPMPENYRVMAASVKHEPRIVPIQACVAAQDGSRFMSTHLPAWGNKVADAPTELEVPALSLASLMQRHAIERIDVLKVDIEGGEKELFEHAQFLEKTDLVLIELHSPYSMQEFQRAIAPYGFIAKPPSEGFIQPFARRHAPG